ncbi:MAG TPA: SPOR domain-containing protein [Sulfurospirillum arcachonense]|nr:SPOR domain-containing protein [Sulfurospirillum arcachonense]
MEDKNELSDIVLEKNDNKSMKAKRILIIVALLIVVFLVVLVVMRVVNKPTQQSNNTKLILPPNPTQKVIEPKKEDDLFKQVPIVEEEDKKESFEEMVKSLKAKEIQKQENIQPKVEEIQEVVETIKTKVETKIVTPPKKIEKAAKPIKAKLVKQTTNDLATTGVYVQVGATSRLTPDKKFLAKLASKSYEYRLLPIDVKGTKVTKILIGPYANSTAAKAVLADIKSSINKDAFIYRVK